MAKILGKKDYDEKTGNIEIRPRSRNTIKKDLDYLLNKSDKNQYCPYLQLSEDKTYYVILNKEKKFIYLSQETVNCLSSQSNYSIKIYLYLLARYNFMETVNEKSYYFTITELANCLGLKTDKINGKAYLWKDSTDQTEQGCITHALSSLVDGGFIDYKKVRDKNGHIFRKLITINTAKTMAKQETDAPIEMTKEEELEKERQDIKTKNEPEFIF